MVKSKCFICTMLTRNWYHYEIKLDDKVENKRKPICTPCIDKYGDKLNKKIIQLEKKTKK